MAHKGTIFSEIKTKYDRIEKISATEMPMFIFAIEDTSTEVGEYVEMDMTKIAGW